VIVGIMLLHLPLATYPPYHQPQAYIDPAFQPWSNELTKCVIQSQLFVTISSQAQNYGKRFSAHRNFRRAILHPQHFNPHQPLCRRQLQPCGPRSRTRDLGQADFLANARNRPKLSIPSPIPTQEKRWTVDPQSMRPLH
jgi:hypothetical protein